jgi:hypothetical protein
MKLSRMCLAALAAGCAFGSLNAAESAKHVKKLYLDKQAVNVTEKGIVVSSKSGSLRLKVLRSDEKGLYVYRRDICEERIKGFDDPDYWARCPDCGAIFENPWDERAHKNRCPKRRKK